jgi:pyruvate, orthophosphate dikinase
MSSGGTASADGRLYVLDGDGHGDSDPRRVGIKAANLMRMADAGLAVPSGFVLGVDVCADYHAGGERVGEDVIELIGVGLAHVEQRTGRRFAARRRPLLVSVRSGAAASMPGMLDTVLNVGLSEVTVPALLRATGDPIFVWDSYRRLIETYAEVVEGCPVAPFSAVTTRALRRAGVPVASELGLAALQEIVEELLAIFREEARREFPQDPMQQLLGAIEGVLRSWDAPRAVAYRRLEGLTDLEGTAVTVQAMVFGNLGPTSGSGVGFTRDPATGEDRLYVDFLLDAQGEDVVGGRHGSHDPDAQIAAVPGLADRLQTVRRALESVFGDAQDFEFTVEDGALWLLQTRAAKRTAWAALRIACDLVDDGVIDPPTALARLQAYDIDTISRSRLASDQEPQPVAQAVPASAGVACGRIALDVATATRFADAGQQVILVREQLSTDDIAGLSVCRRLVTAAGARTSHAAVVARHLGIACLVGCRELSINLGGQVVRIGSSELHPGDTITVDGTDGRIYVGELMLIDERPLELIARVRDWQQTFA